MIPPPDGVAGVRAALMLVGGWQTQARSKHVPRGSAYRGRLVSPAVFERRFRGTCGGCGGRWAAGGMGCGTVRVVGPVPPGWMPF